MLSIFLSLLLAGLFIGLVPVAALAKSNTLQSTGPQTVVDYYMLLPDMYFEVTREQRLHWMLDPKRGAIVDKKMDICMPLVTALRRIYFPVFLSVRTEAILLLSATTTKTMSSKRF
jgi:hypothetical protein